SLLEHLGIDRPAGIRGNLFQLEQDSDRAISYSRYTVRPDDPHARMGLAAQIRGQWKLIEETDREGDLLFNLPLDPLEKDDRSEEGLNAYRPNRYALDMWLKTHRRPRRNRSVISDETVEDLRALGYVQ
ncbi:MAG: hypothetical protein ABFS37_14700, partial [Acidobacteriota bacterium]